MENRLGTTKYSRSLNATAAGTTSVNGAILDMTGFNSVTFKALLGALTAGQQTRLKAQVGNLANGSDMVDLVCSVTGLAQTGLAADTDGNKLLVLELCALAGLVGYRYVRPVLVRGTANAVIDGIIAEQFNAANNPPTQDVTVSQAIAAR